MSQEMVFGGCTGPDAQYIKLISSDEHEVIIKEEYTRVSKTIQEKLYIRNVLNDDEENSIKFEDIQSHLLVKVCQYFMFRHRYTTKHFDFIPKFPVDPKIMPDLLRVANVLKC